MGKILIKGRKLARRDPIAGSTPLKSIVTLPLTPNPDDDDLDAYNDPETPTKKRKFTAISPTISKLKANNDPLDPLLTPPNTPHNVFSDAKALFQRSSSSKVYGRQKEREFIAHFLAPLIKKKNGHGALYLSGVPGTGKSALLNETLERIAKVQPHVHIASINCMIVDKPELIYNRIYNSLVERGQSKGFGYNKHTKEVNLDLNLASDTDTAKIILQLDHLFLKTNACHVVILDELDHIMTEDQEVLFRIFQWAFMENSNLILVGIANALDLTDRFLPRLRANSLTPEILAFTPYTGEEIQYVIEQKLRALDKSYDGPLPYIQPSAISLVAKKTAAYTGDIRKAMDICRRAIEMVEEETRRDDPTRLSDFSVENAPRASIVHVSKICSIAFGGSSVSRIKALNLQQKAVICVLIKAERSPTTQTLTLLKLYELYSKVSSGENLIQKLTLGEFLEVANVLESSGLISVSGICGRKGLGSSGCNRRTSRGGAGASAGIGNQGGSRDEYARRRVASSVHVMDVCTAIADIPVLRAYVM